MKQFKKISCLIQSFNAVKWMLFFGICFSVMVFAQQKAIAQQKTVAQQKVNAQQKTVAQQKKEGKSKINWITFEQLSVKLEEEKKPVLINFHTSWCVYCRKMEKEVFTDPQIIEYLNKHYYAVSFDAESIDTVYFDGQIFTNTQYTKRRKGFHEIALLLGSRGRQFTVPVTLILDPGLNQGALNI
jgi:thioredoxin-related protein